jgi:hypothetical protein
MQFEMPIFTSVYAMYNHLENRHVCLFMHAHLAYKILLIGSRQIFSTEFVEAHPGDLHHQPIKTEQKLQSNRHNTQTSYQIIIICYNTAAQNK